MAELLNKIPTNLTEYPNSFKRQGAFPLEAYSVFYTMDAAENYAASNPIAYVGQTLAVVTANAEDATVVDDVTFYIIADAAGTLQEVGKATNGDGNSITLTDGVLSLTGFEAAGAATLPQKSPVYKKDAEGNDTEEVDHYELKWVTIDAIVEGDGNTKTVVATAEGETVVRILPKYDADTDTHTYELSLDLSNYALSTDVATAMSSIREEVTAVDAKIGKAAEGETLATGVYAAIDAALAEAKAYADENDADTAYDDTTVKGDISNLTDRVDNIEGALGNSTTGGIIKDIADNRTAIETEKTRAEDAEAQVLADAKAYTDEEVAGIDVVIEAREGVEFIVLKNKLGTEIAAVNASKFVQDSFLDDVAYDATTRKITFTWSMGDGSTKTDEIEVADLVDTYTAGSGLTLVDNTFTVDTTVVATQEDIAALSDAIDIKLGAEDVDSAIDAKITAENLGQYAKTTDVEDALAGKVDTETYATEKATFATKDDIGAINVEVAKKLDTDTYNTEKATFALAEDVTEQLAAMDIRIGNVYTKSDADDTFATIAGVADTYATKEALAATDSKAASNETAITNLTGRLDGIVAQGGEPNVINNIKVNGVTQSIAEDKSVDISVPVIANTKVEDLKDGLAVVTQINQNVEDIAAAVVRISQTEARLNNEETGLAILNTRLGALETEVQVGAESRIDVLEGSVTTLTTTTGEHTASIQDLSNKDTELEAEIDANTAKLAGLSGTVKDYVDAAIEAIPEVDLSDRVDTLTFEAYKTSVNAALETKANIVDVYTKAEADAAFMSQDEVDARINTLIVAADPEGGKTITDIQNLVKYVDENASEISGLISDVEAHDSTLTAHTTAIEDNAQEIAALATTVANGEVKDSDEISTSTAANGGVQLGINQVSISKLVQADGDVLILDGGTASA